MGGSAVVDDDVDREVLRDRGLDLPQEPEQLVVAMAAG
jgi:hypothetical protein